MLQDKINEIINAGLADAMLKDIVAVAPCDLESYKRRITSAVSSFGAIYGKDRDVSVFTGGGRSEISGNHTDHNGGRVIAAAVNLDIIAVAAPRDDGIIRVKSEGFRENVVKIENCKKLPERPIFASTSLIAGIVHAFMARGYNVGGFDAYTTSNVIKGSGLSSSAAFEVMIGKILSAFYNTSNVDTKEIAKSSQYAENVFFGKPCGLMDQMACAIGGLITIDFSNKTEPDVRAIDFDFGATGLSLCITNTGSSHSDLNDDYAAVPAEMKGVAALFGKERLCEISEDDVMQDAPKIRESLGDRALLRALHFFEENRRVAEQTAALEAGDIDRFLDLVTESGRSSFCYLQNVYSPRDVKNQAISLALFMSEKFLKSRRGACRIQGGGFAGTIEAFVPTEDTEEYRALMESVFGKDCCKILNIRPSGPVKLI